MASRESDIQQLRTELQRSRWELHDTLHQVEDRFNIPRRIKTEVAAHPARWIIVALGAGIIASALLRSRGQGWMRNLVSPVLRIAFMTAIPALLRGRPPKPISLE